MIERMVKELRRPLPSYMVVLSGLMLFMFGLWFLLPFNTFEFSPLYSVMESVMSETAWGLVGVSFGTIKIVGGAIGHCTSIKIASLAGAAHWGIIAVCYWIATYTGAMPIVVTFLFIQSVAYYLNAALSDPFVHPVYN